MDKPLQGSSEEEISFVGEVQWIPIEGGFYGLVAEDGRKFLPLNLPEGFQKDGLRVRVKGQSKKVITFRMWGIPLEVREIEIYTGGGGGACSGCY